MDRFATKEALVLIGGMDTETPRPYTLETFYSPDESEQVQCTTDEREDFENSHEVILFSDVVEDSRDYDAFVRFLAEQCGLERM